MGWPTGFELSGSQTDLQASLESIGSPEKINVAEIDPESVRHELRALMTQMNQVELERVRWLGERTRGLGGENGSREQDGTEKIGMERKGKGMK